MKEAAQRDDLFLIGHEQVKFITKEEVEREKNSNKYKEVFLNALKDLAEINFTGHMGYIGHDQVKFPTKEEVEREEKQKKQKEFTDIFGESYFPNLK